MSAPSQFPRRVAILGLLISLSVLAFLVSAWWTTSSLLALSQAADSAADLLAGSVLLWAAAVSATPADEEHPHGHHAAEPIAALVVALLAGGLSMQVLRSALDALIFGYTPLLDWMLLGALGGKTVLKACLYGIAVWSERTVRSPVLRALAIDARNDVVVGAAAVLGFFAARYGWLMLDAWLAIPAAVWVAWGGLELARENVAMLMGESASEVRHQEIGALIASVPGVLGLHELVVRHEGPELVVSVHVVLDEHLSLRQAHDLGEIVERRLLDEADVARATVHLDVDDVAPGVGVRAVHAAGDRA